MKEIRIRKVDDSLDEQLKAISEKYEYASFNQFMLDQLQTIVNNDGLNIYHNRFAIDLSEIKTMLSHLLELQLERHVHLINLETQVEVNGLLVEKWIAFLEDIEAVASERKGGEES
ncbi:MULTISPECIES: hypothetical protein [unclassified Streptococcus]|uniref:hypothetical protein n=1 Tax=unclassified Streptococcus TaxID=2608887 RepID=UPI00211B2B7B|nr:MULTISPECIES: hypothetical protein [unclassified Streptococcus]MCQ9212388.1 hypothetical protein [Streptococcus sp. B01]MCQ9213728.1 hypothetical protein [Streptococcus sp. O1]MCQ9214512.1 hypothetical protein [Streptococcus sp. O1]